MWNWKPEKRILEDLFAAGEVVVAGRESFQRLYALPEQRDPARSTSTRRRRRRRSSVRGYALRAVQGRGALTESGIAEHCRFRGGVKAMRPVVDALVARGARPAGRGRRRRRAGRRPGGCASSTARRRAAFSSARSTTCVWDRAVPRARLRLPTT